MLPQWMLVKFFNFWPPFVGAGVRIQRVTPDFREIDVELKLRWWNRNYVGTHFGGTLFAMTDPFYMVMLIQCLGSEYIVWDKSAQIFFKKPGRGKVRAEFRITDERLDEIRGLLRHQEKIDYPFTVLVKDADGQIITEVIKTIYIRKKSSLTLRSAPELT